MLTYPRMYIHTYIHMYVCMYPNYHCELVVCLCTYVIHINTGDDYEHGPFSFTIPAGEINVLVNVSLNDDNIFESLI